MYWRPRLINSEILKLQGDPVVGLWGTILCGLPLEAQASSNSKYWRKILLCFQQWKENSNHFALHWNTLQFSCLKNPIDGGAWKAAVHGVTESNMTEWLHFHFSLSCIGEGNGNPLQYSCLENPRDGGTCWAAVYGVAQSQTRISSSSCRNIKKKKEKNKKTWPALWGNYFRTHASGALSESNWPRKWKFQTPVHFILSH